MADVYFFGCNEQSGHYLHPRRYEDNNPHIQQLENQLDGNLLVLPWPEKRGTGALTYLPVLGMTCLSWWGSPWDTRGAVNNSVLVRGQCTADEVWAAFEKAFPRLAPQLQRPTLASV